MLPEIVPVTEVKRNAAQVLDQLRKDKRPVLITEHGRAAAILLDIASYEELTKRADVLDRMIQLQPQITKTMGTIWSDISKAIQCMPTQGSMPASGPVKEQSP